MNAAARGLAAGVAGTAALTLSQRAEMALTGREASDLPARVAERALRTKFRGRTRERVAFVTHWVNNSQVGLSRAALDAAGVSGGPAVAGTFAAGAAGVEQNLWLIALVALPVIILGGLDSLPGAVIGGLAVGVIQEVVAQYERHFPAWVGGNVSIISPYVLMLLVLLVRPYGLFGTREVERV